MNPKIIDSGARCFGDSGDRCPILAILLKFRSAKRSSLAPSNVDKVVFVHKNLGLYLDLV